MKLSFKNNYSGVLITFCILFASCVDTSTDRSQNKGEKLAISEAVAVLHGTEGNEITGVVTFTTENGGIRVVAHVTGLADGDHGFHVHQYGDCTSPDGKSAGGHFNPDGVEHAGPNAAKRHIGDLGNITADESGTANYDRIDSYLSLNGPNSIIGRAVILHAKADDLTSQPTGAAGARLACGVIGIGKN